MAKKKAAAEKKTATRPTRRAKERKKSQSRRTTTAKSPSKTTPRKVTKKEHARPSGKKQSEAAAGEQRQPAHPIVGIGASAGGLQAMQEFFDHLPADSGMAFVVVTHQHAGHTSLLPDLLTRHSQMPVVEAADGVAVRPNQVYVGPPGVQLAIFGGALQVMESDAKAVGVPLPIDFFFRSLADDQRERAICVVLSGTGTDGTLGLRAVKAASGMAMVQHVESAQYPGMPSSAIATGMADYILPPAAMPEQLVAYVRGPYPISGRREPAVVPDAPVQKILVVLRNRTGHDFSSYKSSTVCRRIERRMNVQRIQGPDRYLRFLEDNPHELDILFKELLISVTSFFRDPEAFAALCAGPLPKLLKSRPDNDRLRAWVPGCATGEEAYTVAISLHECAEAAGKRCEFQIFGTDLDNEAIETARSGLYPEGIAVDVMPDRLKRFFVQEEAGYRVCKAIREMAVFAQQNVIKDPPFTKLDLICCRNLLIYLEPEMQQQLLRVFHYALRPDGLLMLGPSESVGGAADLFRPADKKWKIFQRAETALAAPLPGIPMHVSPASNETTTGSVASSHSGTGQPQIAKLVEQLLLSRYAPASVVVNDRGDMLYIHGRTGAYLEPTAGRPRMNLLDMAREGLRTELAACLRQISSRQTEVRRENIRVKANGEYVHVDLHVTKILDPETIRGLVLVSFRPASPPAEERPRKTGGRGKAKSTRAEQLELELQNTRESLHTTVEELETSIEELKSTNEELQSTNEELQSTNEELETSKEEMQSLNEELTTVNSELQAKMGQLSQANDDMQNLLNSIEVATVFLDDDLRIKRYTDTATKLIKLIQTDVGRPIGDLASNLKYAGLEADAREVLRTLAFKEFNVETKDGRFYAMRIMPYRTAENVIDGLVITFVDVDRLVAAQQLDQEARSYFESIVETVRHPLVVLDDGLRMVSANRAFYRMFQLTPKDVENKLIRNIGNGDWDIPELRRRLKAVLSQDDLFEDFEVCRDFRKAGRKRITFNGRRLRREAGLPAMILLAMSEVTGEGK